METLFSPWLIQLIGWAIIHSLWQTILIAILLALILRMLSGFAPNVHYALSCSALALMLVCPVATSFCFNLALSISLPVEKANVPTVGVDTSKQPAKTNEIVIEAEEKPLSDIYSNFKKPLNLAEQAENFFSWLILFWILGVMIFSLRLSGGFLYTRRLIKSANQARDPSIKRMLDELMFKLKIKRTVRVLESAMIKVPMTVGCLYPVILLPPSALLGLTPQQMQTIIAHELVHIKRFDFLVNVLQAAVEILLFYHPAAKWVSGRVRRERELICDDRTLALCGDAVIYARALTKIARFENKLNYLATAAVDGNLTSRIHRLLINSNTPTPTLPRYFSSVFAIAFLFLIVLVGLEINVQFGRNTKLGDQFPQGINKIGFPNQKIEENGDSLENDRLKIYGDDLSKERLLYRKIAVEALEGYNGSVIIMNPQTGQVFTIVNQNYALRHNWSPASIFKLVTSTAALEERLLKNSEKGLGYDTTTHKNLIQALATSDSFYFKSLGRDVGAESILKYAREFGLGVKTGINYPGEIEGFVPKNAERKTPWLGASGEDIEVTPIQLAILMSAIANGGKLLVPQATADSQPIAPRERGKILISENTLLELRKGLREAVENGTGKAADNSVNTVAGKTGTAVSKENGIGLFVSYAPVVNPRLLVVVGLEGKNKTGTIAARIAGEIYGAFNESLNYP